MADHQDAPFLLSKLGECTRVACVRGERLLDQHVEAVLQARTNDLEVRLRRRAHDHGIEVHLEQIPIVVGEVRDLRMAGHDPLECQPVQIDHGFDGYVGELEERPDDVRSPVAAPDHADLQQSQLVRTLPQQHDGDRQQQDLQIEQRRATLQVLEVEPNHLFEVDTAPPTHLRPARHAWAAGQPSKCRSFIMLDLVGHRRAGADETHVAFEDVPQLRQLIQTEFA